MIDKYRLEDMRRESGEKGELARWVIQLQADLDREIRKSASERAMLSRLAVIMHGSETDLNLLTVTTQSLMDRCKAGNSPVIGIDMASEPDRSVEVRYLAPPGYVMVPKEITCAMDDAAWEVYHETRCMSDIWAALLAAAPQQEVKS